MGTKPLLATAVLSGLLNLSPSLAQTTARREFEVASIKPNNIGPPKTYINPFVFSPGGRFTATNVTFVDLVILAYRTSRIQLQGGPPWIDSERFDVAAKADMDQGELKREQWSQMFQGLLKDRFQLAVHEETKDMPVYALVPGKNLPRLQPAKEGEVSLFTPGPRGQMNFQKMPLVGLVNTLANILHTPVVDQTGITGFFDFTLDPIQFMTPPSADNPVRPDYGELVMTAIQEQLGFRIEKKRAPIELLVIDHVEKPTEN